VSVELVLVLVTPNDFSSGTHPSSKEEGGKPEAATELEDSMSADHLSEQLKPVPAVASYEREPMFCGVGL
jgi:hypothetical protein